MSANLDYIARPLPADAGTAATAGTGDAARPASSKNFMKNNRSGSAHDGVEPEGGRKQGHGRDIPPVQPDADYYDISGFATAPLVVGREIVDGPTNRVAVAVQPATAAPFAGITAGATSDRASRADVYSNEYGAGASDGQTGGQAASQDPTEVNPLVGTDGNDVLHVYDGGDLPDNWSTSVFAQGGNDLIVRDMVGWANGNVLLNGGSGVDIVSYAMIAAPALVGVNVDLKTGFAFRVGESHHDNLAEIEGVMGTIYSDVLIGDGKANYFYGLDGHDNINGDAGDDNIWGGSGDDTLFGGSGNDHIEGDDGDDEISGGSGADTIHGGDGDDDISGGGQDDLLSGGDGYDTITGGGGNDIIHDGDGNDDVDGYAGNDTFYLGNGNDSAGGQMGDDTFHLSGFGNNTISGGTGNDTVVFGNAAVVVNLAINTAIRGAEGTDTIAGVENIITGSGADLLAGSNYANAIHSGGGGDLVSGLQGDDTIFGGSGGDELWGNEDDDLILGESGNDELFGNVGEDTLVGGSGEDTISGGDEVDYINGGEGEDRIRGGAGADDLWGGNNADFFVWNDGDSGIDHIHDFSLAEDRFSFGDGFFAANNDPTDLSDVLVAWHDGADSHLAANTAANGWEFIASLDGVDASTLNQMIANGSIFQGDPSFEGPGGKQIETPVVQIVTEFDFIV